MASPTRRKELEQFLRSRNCVYEYFAREGFQNRCQRSLYASTFARTAIKTDTPRQGGQIINLPTAGWPSSGRIDPAYSNVCLRSEELNVDGAGSPWTHQRATVTGASITGPMGTVNGCKFTEDSSVTNTHRAFISFSATSGQAYTATAWILAGTRTWAEMHFGSTPFGTQGGYINLSDGSVGAVTGATASVIDRVTISGVGTWYRFRITATATSTGTATLVINMATQNGTPSFTDGNTYTGDGVSYLYVTMVQIETGSIAHPYYPTTTIAAGPDADVFTANVGLTGDTLGGRTYIDLIETDYAWASYPTAAPVFLHVLDGANDRVTLKKSGANLILTETDATVETTLATITGPAAGRHVIVSVAQSGNSFMMLDSVPTAVSTQAFTHTATTTTQTIGGSGFRHRAHIICDRALTLREAHNITRLLKAANP